MYGARRNNPDQLAVAAQRETDVKQPILICVSESIQPDLIRTMADILYNQTVMARPGVRMDAVEFIEENGGGPGVRLRKRHRKKA